MSFSYDTHDPFSEDDDHFLIYEGKEEKPELVAAPLENMDDLGLTWSLFI